MLFNNSLCICTKCIKFLLILQDPKNKQWAICDDKLLKVIGEKKFKCFGMAKYLKDHLS